MSKYRGQTRRGGPPAGPFDMLAAVEQVAKAARTEPTVGVPPAPADAAPILDARGYRRAPATFAEFHQGREPRNKGKTYRPNPPTVAEIMAMLRACPDDIYGHRIYAAILLGWQGALRVFELLALTAADLDRASGSIQIQHGKGDKQATIKMAAWAWPLLDPWLELRKTLPNPDGPLICVIDGPTAGRAWSQADSRKVLKRIAVEAGVTKRMSWHQLRHAWAVWSYVDGTDIRTVQLHLRHAHIGITDIYLGGMGVGRSHDVIYQAAVPSIPATALLELTRG